MKETYTAQDSAFLAESASASHDLQAKNRSNPVVPKDLPDDDDEPPNIRPPVPPTISSSTTTKIRDDDPDTLYSPSSITRVGSEGSNVCSEKRPFDRDPDELAQHLHTSLNSGLDDSEAQNRLKLHGKNILKGQGKVTVWAVLWRQVSNAMTVILLGALAIAFATEDYAEGGVIAGTTALLLFSSELDLFSDDSDRCCQCWYWIFSGISRGEDHGITQEIKFPHCHSHKNTQRSLDRRLHSHFRHHHRRSRRTSNRSSRPGRSPSIQHLQSRNR